MKKIVKDKMKNKHRHKWDILHLTNDFKKDMIPGNGGCFSHRHTEICIICKKTKEEIKNEKK